MPPGTITSNCTPPTKHGQWKRILVAGSGIGPVSDACASQQSSLVYLPSTVGPIGFIGSGLPVGYQAIAASGCDKSAIAFSRLIEKEIVGFVPPPGFD